MMKGNQINGMKFLGLLFLVMLGLNTNACRLWNIIPQKPRVPDNYLNSARQIQKNLGSIQTVIGQYQIIPDYSKADPMQSRYVEVRLKDGYGLALETGDAGIRSESEITQYGNKNVAITGTIKSECILASDGYFSTFQSFCIENISQIESVHTDN